MQKSRLNKTLTDFLKSNAEAQAAVNFYERGLITFNECLQLITEAEHKAAIIAAKNNL